MLRIWLATGVILILITGCPSDEFSFRTVARIPAAYSAPQPPSGNFPYGVASGDPLPDRVIIWTLLDTATAHRDSLVRWEMSTDRSFQAIVRADTVTARQERHYRIKVDVDGLAANTTYYYRFVQGEETSRIGRTRTAPEGGDAGDVHLAVVSCNAYEWGHFNAFANLAATDGLSAVVHLGDYIYEYASGDFGDVSLGRLHEPRHEAVTADDYYVRYAQYRQDPDLQAAHAAHPFICVWDDHEVANDSHLEGAENHQPATEGDYLTRITAAREIYYDWMPIREDHSGRLYRSFDFGRTTALHMLDERLAGRTPPASDFDPAHLADTTRRMLGEPQFNWLTHELRTTQTDWQLIGNQVMFARLDLANILPEYAVNLDAWDGYRYEKERLLDSLAIYGQNPPVFLTGDTHCSWYFDIPDRKGGVAAHEIATPSVSSANYDEFIDSWDTLAIARYRLYRDNEHLEFTDLTRHGYVLLHVTPDQLTAQFHYLRTIKNRDCREDRPVTYRIANVRYAR